MQYVLLSGVDTRDNRPMLWLCEYGGDWRVALFHPKTSFSRIRNRTTVAPDKILWSSRSTMAAYCDKPITVAKWETPG